MDINNMKALSYDDLRVLYRNYLNSQEFTKKQSILLAQTLSIFGEKGVKTCSGIQ